MTTLDEIVRIEEEEQNSVEKSEPEQIISKLQNRCFCYFYHFLSNYASWSDFLNNLGTEKYVRDTDEESFQRNGRPFATIIKGHSCIHYINK
jgi:hypothetical protein